MASGGPVRSAFTDNSIGGTPGESDGMVKSKVPGGTLISPYTMDNVHGVNLKGTMCEGAGNWGGSDFNLAHSLKGASAVQDHTPRSGKSGKKEI